MVNMYRLKLGIRLFQKISPERTFIMVPAGFSVNQPAKNNLGLLNVSTVPLECVYAYMCVKRVILFRSFPALVRALT